MKELNKITPQNLAHKIMYQISNTFMRPTFQNMDHI